MTTFLNNYGGKVRIFFLLWFSEWEILPLHIRMGLSLPVHVASIRINHFFFQAAGRNCKYFQNLDIWIV